MKKLKSRLLSILMATVMLFGLLPLAAFAENNGAAGMQYSDFLASLTVLEEYADVYAREHSGEDATALVINYIRTGVEKYTSGAWTAFCGPENTNFSGYVAEQDTANSTTAGSLRSLNEFKLPNGDAVDFAHMFGAMDMAYHTGNQSTADLGSWAGDIADLMFCAENVDIPDKVDTTETDVDILAANIRTKYLGVDYGTLNSVGHSFTDTDLYGDMDAFYLLDNEFHGCLLEAVGKKDVMEIIREDYIHFRRWRNFYVVRSGRQREIIEEHTALMHVLVKNETKEAHEILHMHLNTENRLRHIREKVSPEYFIYH